MSQKRCNVCQTRPATPESPEGQLCQPCLTEAGWENTHSDWDHEGYRSWTLKNTNFKTRKELQAAIEEVAVETTACWICHPELNEAKAEYTPRGGTSRAGMVIHVPLRATGADKARLAVGLLDLTDGNIRTNYGVTTLKSKALDLELSWDARGRYVGGRIASRKVRNVSDAMRVLGR